MQGVGGHEPPQETRLEAKLTQMSEDQDENGSRLATAVRGASFSLGCSTWGPRAAGRQGQDRATPQAGLTL